MKKVLLTLLLITVVLLLGGSATGMAQTTETFLNDGNGSTTFSQGGVNFTIGGGHMKVRQYAGWGRTDDWFVDNSTSIMTSNGLIGSFSSTTSFYIHDLWIVQLNSSMLVTGNNNVNIIGKLDGVTKFTRTVLYNEFNQTATDRYFTHIDLSAYSSTLINSIEFVSIDYESYVVGALMIDDFRFTMASSAPTVTTQAVSDITTTTATGNGNVTATGGANITERGIYYSTTNGFADGTGTKVSTTGDWGSTGTFTQAITGLTAGTTYYVKAFATNSAGTGYGSQVDFTTIACTNPTNGGTITANQIIGSGSSPAEFISTAAPSGHTGTLEYKWQKSTTSSAAGFADISNSNSATYSSAELTQTTWFKRLARVDCKSDWVGAAESNLILVKVNQKPTDQTVSPASQSIISGNSATISISSSESSTSYYLRDNSNNAVVDGSKPGTGSAIDFNTGNLASSKTYNVYAEKAHALQFDGTNDYVSVNHTFPAFNNYTISTWVYLTAATSPKFFSSSNYELAIVSGKIQLWIAGRSGITGTTDLTMNQWNYVTVTYNGTSLSIYINGNLDNSVATSVDALPSISYLAIGKHFAAACCYVNGYMAELSFESSSHTQAEIQSKMMNGYTGSEPGLVAYYTFGDGAGSSTLTDKSSNQFNGTLVNMNTQTAWISNCNQQMTTISTVTVYTLPTVTTQDVSSISTTTATGNGNITSLGSPNPSAYGVCWNTNGTPTITDSKVDKGAASATGVFTASITNLSPETKYYVRAFATNLGGTVYGDEVNFTTLKAYFSDGTNQYATWSEAIAGTTEGGTITMLDNYTLSSDVVLSKSLTLNIAGYTFSGTNATSIGDGKSLALNNTLGTGAFSGVVSYSGTTSSLRIYKAGILGANFVVSASSTASGMIEIGNGSAPVTYPLTIGDGRFNSKVSKVVVKSSATVNVSKP